MTYYQKKLLDYALHIKKMCLGYGGMIKVCQGCPFCVDSKCELTSTVPALWQIENIIENI